MALKDLRNEFGNPAEDYKCPNCGCYPIASTYQIDAELYPKVYNEHKYSDMGHMVHDWDELHCCPDCGTMFWFANGN